MDSKVYVRIEKGLVLLKLYPLLPYYLSLYIIERCTSGKRKGNLNVWIALRILILEYSATVVPEVPAAEYLQVDLSGV